jgi:hypothetical protein
LRLEQEEVIKGKNSYGILGLKVFDCEKCDKSGPNQGEELKQQRGCHRGGRAYEGTGKEYRIDFTGVDTRDFALFCPGSVQSDSVQRQVNRVFEIERLKKLGNPMARPILHQPKRIKDFFLATLAARDRFENEIAQTIKDLSEAS